MEWAATNPIRPVEPLTWTNWGPGQPEGGQICVSLEGIDRKWYCGPRYANSPKVSFCEYNPASPP